jgi:hypothetical protein
MTSIDLDEITRQDNVSIKWLNSTFNILLLICEIFDNYLVTMSK